MKKLLSLLLCAVLCLVSPGISALAYEYNPFVDDVYEISGGVMGGGEFCIIVDTAPFIYDGRTFLPVRFVERFMLTLRM